MDHTLQRITTEYIPFEDRIKLAGLIGESQPVVMWLTQRLLRRLLPALFSWLERQSAPVPRPEVMLSFAQEAARAVQMPQKAVSVVSGGAEWVVQTIDLAMAEEAVAVAFQHGDADKVRLPMHATLLRQWLGILYDAAVEAEWPLDLWPAWFREAATPAKQASMVLH